MHNCKQLFFWFSCLFLIACSKDKLGQNPSEISFKLLTLNTFLLDTPDVTNGPSCESDCVSRAISICETLQGKFDELPDLLMLQEVFESDACNSLTACLQSLGYTYVSPCLEGDPSWNNSCLVESTKSSGLLLASKRSLEDYQFNSYTDCNGCLFQGGDCQANKGFQYAILNVSPSYQLHLINTHMDAGDTNGDREARQLQLLQLHDFIKSKTGDANPSIIYGGDFNISSTGELQELELRLEATSINSELPTSVSGKILDHIMVSSNSKLIFNNYQLSQSCESDCINWFESDHYGLLGEFTVNCD